MFDRVVIGYDGSEGADDALALATAVAPVVSAIRVVHAFPGPVFERANAAERAAREAAERPLEAARSRLEGRPGARFVAQSGASVPATLQRVAANWPADLIVLGSNRRAFPGRVGIGRVGDRTVHGAPCPVLFAPSGYRTAQPETMARLGVGFPGTGESRAALLLAAQLAEDAGTELDVIDVGRPVEDFDAVEKAVAGVVGSSRAPIETELPEGDPADILIERSHRLDLLVVGQRGFGALRRLITHSVSHDLLRHAACPVLVVPRP